MEALDLSIRIFLLSPYLCEGVILLKLTTIWHTSSFTAKPYCKCKIYTPLATLFFEAHNQCQEVVNYFVGSMTCAFRVEQKNR